MNRTILKPFDDQEKTRTQFVNTIAELAEDNSNIAGLHSSGVLQLLRPMLSDLNPSIRQQASMALGRIANHSEELATAIVTNEILPLLKMNLDSDVRFYQKSAAYVLKSIARHSITLAKNVVDCGVVEKLISCLKGDPSVKEMALQTLEVISTHDADLANAVVKANVEGKEPQALNRIIASIQDPEMTVKRVSIATLINIVKHSEEFAASAVTIGAIQALKPLISYADSIVKRNALNALSQLAKHNNELATQVLEADVLFDCINRLKDNDLLVKKNAATLLRELSKRSENIAQAVVNAGAIYPLVEFVEEARNSGHTQCLPAIICLGFIAAWQEGLAHSILQAGSSTLLKVLKEEAKEVSEDEGLGQEDPEQGLKVAMKGAAAWSLGQIGRHSEPLANSLCEEGKETLGKLLGVYLSDLAKDNDSLRAKLKTSMNSIITMCKHIKQLTKVQNAAPQQIMKCVLEKLKDLFADKEHSKSAKTHFVKELGFQNMLKWNKELTKRPDSYADATATQTLIDTIVKMFPERVKIMYDPDIDEMIRNEIKPPEN